MQRDTFTISLGGVFILAAGIILVMLAVEIILFDKIRAADIVFAVLIGFVLLKNDLHCKSSGQSYSTNCGHICLARFQSPSIVNGYHWFTFL